MKSKYKTYIKWINIAADYFMLNFAVCVVYFTINLVVVRENLPEYYRLNVLLLNVFWFFCSSIVRLYDNALKRDAVPTIETTSACLILYSIVLLILKLMFPRFNLFSGQLLYFLLLFSSLIMCCKFSFLLLRRFKRSFLVDPEKVVIVGAGTVGISLYDYISTNPHLGYKVEGIFDDEFSNDLSYTVRNPVRGNLASCLNFAVMNGIKEIYCTLPNRELSKIKALMQEADKNVIRFKLVPDLEGLFNSSNMFQIPGHLPILTPRYEPLENKANELGKRLFDILFSSLVIIFLLSWLFPILALIIKLESRGPVLFKQLRSGKGNKPFYCLKFRSMSINPDADTKQACKGDVRVTRVGTILRKTSLDELPQFINVLMGDMSVVGPRPHMLKHTQDYSLLVNNFMVRHFLMPGITGWAQVNGYRGEIRETTAMSKRVEADLWYLENWSLLLDIKIIFLTVWQAIKGSENVY